MIERSDTLTAQFVAHAPTDRPAPFVTEGRPTYRYAGAAPALVEPKESVHLPTVRRITLNGLLRSRGVLAVLAVRDFKVKFKQSLAGPLWIAAQPVVLLAAFVVGFGNVVDARIRTFHMASLC